MESSRKKPPKLSLLKVLIQSLKERLPENAKTHKLVRYHPGFFRRLLFILSGHNQTEFCRNSLSSFQREKRFIQHQLNCSMRDPCQWKFMKKTFLFFFFLELLKILYVLKTVYPLKVPFRSSRWSSKKQKTISIKIKLHMFFQIILSD